MGNATSSTRVKISVTVDPELVSAIEAYVADHEGQDRSKVINQALWLWVAQQQEEAMAAQFADWPSDVDPDEWAAWKQIRLQAAERTLRPRS